MARLPIDLFTTNSESSYAAVTAATAVELYSMAFAANDIRLAQMSILYIMCVYNSTVNTNRVILKNVYFIIKQWDNVCLFPHFEHKRTMQKHEQKHIPEQQQKEEERAKENQKKKNK